MSNLTIAVERSQALKPKPDPDKLGFGIHFTDHMFMMDYEKGKGWHSPRITPYGNIELDPAAKVFHYGQAVFEGLKAFHAKDGNILLFRPDQNIERMNRSNDRLCMPQLDEEIVLEGMKQLIRIDRDWVPTAPGTALYIRPFIMATQPALGLANSQSFKFIIIMSPVGAYYETGIKPVRIFVESDYVRAVKGGVGEAKTSGNYAAAMAAQEEAARRGYTQVLWLDGVHRRYIEEVGSMNVFVKMNGTVYTPSLGGSILHGITRSSMIHLLRHWGIPIEERPIAIDEIYESWSKGELDEAFGTGTAAVISPIGELFWDGKAMPIHGGVAGELSTRLYDTLTGIQQGTVADEFGWMVQV